MRITGGNVFSGGAFVEAAVEIADGRIAALAPSQAALAAEGDIDATGCYVVPGFIDIHFHGCVGADLCDAPSVRSPATRRRAA